MSSPIANEQFPVILELATKTRYTLRGIEVFVVGRDPRANLTVLDEGCSRRQFHIVRRGRQFMLENLSRNIPTLCDGSTVSGPVPLAHGMKIEAGGNLYMFLERNDLPPAQRGDASGTAAVPRPAAPPAPAPPPTAPPTSPPPVWSVAASGSAPGADGLAGSGTSADRAGATPAKPATAEDRGHQVTFVGKSDAPVDLQLPAAFELSGEKLIGREAQRVDIELSHPQVSRVHARITMRPGATIVADMGSANGTFVNGRRISKPQSIVKGDRIDIGPYALLFDGVCLRPRARANNVELACQNLKRVVKDRTTGNPLVILDDITLVFRPKEFACILGPSGSGKSTLLMAHGARLPADQGTVTINGEDFYRNFDALKGDVAVVPQKDVLHDLLSVEKALSYTARLRLPTDTTLAEKKTCIDDILNTVALTERRKTRITDLSGGQIKRASLANEIISKPSLLFLDEVTSGLDEQTDCDMMDLFRKIAKQGKTVICITHSLANVEDYCDLVVVLTVGGKLAFIGKPAEALQYFQIKRLGHVYKRLAERSPEEWKQAFRKHQLYSKYIDSRLRQTADDEEEKLPMPRQRQNAGETVMQCLRQLKLLSFRYLRLQLADSRNLAMMFGQCVLVALLLAIIFGNIEKLSVLHRAAYSGNLLFFMAISCLWFGCNNAAKEIVKEWTIYMRERDVNLTIASYYGSKLLLLSVFSLLQVVVLYGIVRIFTHLPGNNPMQFLFLSAMSIVGAALGLFISAVSKTDDQAIKLVPIVLIPQIVLAGVIAPLTGFGKFLAQAFITAYWGYRGLAALVPEDCKIVLQSTDWSYRAALVALIFHAAFFIAAAFLTLMLRDSSRGGNRAIDRWIAAAKKKIDETVRAIDT